MLRDLHLTDIVLVDESKIDIKEKLKFTSNKIRMYLIVEVFEKEKMFFGYPITKNSNNYFAKKIEIKNENGTFSYVEKTKIKIAFSAVIKKINDFRISFNEIDKIINF